jgi:hypothetical protein
VLDKSTRNLFLPTIPDKFMSEEIVSVEDVDLEDIYRVEVEAWGDE